MNLMDKKIKPMDRLGGLVGTAVTKTFFCKLDTKSWCYRLYTKTEPDFDTLPYIHSYIKKYLGGHLQLYGEEAVSLMKENENVQKRLQLK